MKKTKEVSQDVLLLKAAFQENGGKPIAPRANIVPQGSTEGFNRKRAKEILLADLEDGLEELAAYRNGTHPDYEDKDVRHRSISLKEFALERWGINCEGQGMSNNLYLALGLNPERTTIASLINYGQASQYRFLIPEIFLEALDLSLKLAPVYATLIRSSQNVDNTIVNVPGINGNNNVPRITQEGESIVMGVLSFQNKKVIINKITQGFRLTDEVKKATINMLSLAIMDSARNMGFMRDAMCLAVLQNGDQVDGSTSAPIVGIATANDLIYKDLRRVQTRMAMLGHSPNVVVTGEDASNDISDLPEFKGFAGDKVLQTMRSNLPAIQTIQQVVTPFVPTGSIIYVNTNDAMIELIAEPMRIESGREITTQSDIVTISITVGYASLYRDARVIIDTTDDLSGAPFPDYMNVQTFADRFTANL